MKNRIGIMAIAFTLTQSALAAGTYTCEPKDPSTGSDNLKLVVLGDKQIRLEDQRGDLDASYVPRLNRGYFRFELSPSQEGTDELLVQAKLLNGAAEGLIKLQNRGEGFATDTFVCKAN